MNSIRRAASWLCSPVGLRLEDGEKHPRLVRRLFACVGFLFCFLAYFLLLNLLGLNLLEHSVYDSYTLQAMTWRQGSIALDGNRPWLELAIYEGQYWISFPPLPAVPMWLLTFLFGDLTPSRIVVLGYWLGSYCVAFHMAGRMRANALTSMLWGILAVCGCNLFEVCLYGDVWNMAQALCLLLSLAACDLLLSQSRIQWGFGLFCLALSVGCRPFQAFYVPFAVYWVAIRVWHKERTLWPFLVRMFCLLIAPALFAVILCAYNYVRFDNIFEFGHNYLPEFMEQSTHGQFSVHYMANNFKNILRMPYWQDGWLKFPNTYGFAFWLANPVFVLFGIHVLRSVKHKRWTLADSLLVLCLAAHFAGLLMHKSFGGWQFGTRYLCDLNAFLLLGCLTRQERISRWEMPVFLWAVLFNLYGAYVFHMIL